jgi:hypothetical protein
VNVCGSLPVDQPRQHDRRLGVVDVGGLDPHPFQGAFEIAYVLGHDAQDRVGRARHRRGSVHLWHAGEGRTKLLG